MNNSITKHLSLLHLSERISIWHNFNKLLSVNNKLKKLLVFWLTIFCLPLFAETNSSKIRLYTLNCGYINVHDAYHFSDTAFYGHQSLYLSNPCFLIKHPKGWLLWDLGLGDQYFKHQFEDKKHDATLIVPISIKSQLKELDLMPSDIQYVALSHTHFDHTGNANLFPQATWLIQRTEYQALQQTPLPPATDPSIVPILRTVHKILVNGDYDVFGDDTVIILRTPGHTVGHQSLQIKLNHTGVIILSGDLYHTKRAYHYKQMPSFNANRADTLASMERVDDILKNTKATLIIQHDMKDFSVLPKIPNFLD